MNLGRENEQQEYKESTSELNDAMDDISAILNKHQKGVLYFGVKDDGEVIGFQIGKDTESDISHKIHMFIEPKIYPVIEHIKIETKDVIKVSFDGKHTPYSSNGKYFIRVSDDSFPMTREELVNYIRNRDYSETWETQLSKYDIDEINNDALMNFYNKAKEAGRLEFQEYNKEKLLSYLCLYDNYLNKAGYYLFGKSANINLKLSIFATNDKTICLDLKEVKGNIYNLVDEALKYIYQNIKWEAKMTGKERIDIPEIPEEAIREIIINAFAHAQYETNTEHEIDIYKDRIEIYNPGAFPVNLTPNDFIKNSKKSILRNKLIADVLFRSKYVEKGGSGFQKVNKLCNDNGLDWNYALDDYGFTFIFMREKDLKVISSNNNLDYVERMVLEIITNNPTIKKADIAKKMNKSEKTIQRAISGLVNKEVIVRQGNYKSGYWKLIK